MNEEVDQLGRDPERFKGKARAVNCCLYRGWEVDPRLLEEQKEIPVFKGMPINVALSMWGLSVNVLTSNKWFFGEMSRGGWILVETRRKKRAPHTKDPHIIWLFIRSKADPEKKGLIELRVYTEDYAKIWRENKKAEELERKPWLK
jgi:hypothetical protein